MKFWKLSAVIALVLSSSANAAIVSIGYLTTDDGYLSPNASNIIHDSLNNVEYLRLDVLADFTYSQTLSVLNTQEGGGWSISTAEDALGFAQALLGGTSSCSHDGVSVTTQYWNKWGQSTIVSNISANQYCQTRLN